MTRLRSRQLWCVAMVILAALPLAAQSSVLAPIPASNAIPEGQTFLIKLNDKLDTAKLKQGKKFSAKLAEDLVAPDGAVIPRGKKVSGHVSGVDQGLHARLLLSFDEIATKHGKMGLIATVTGVPGEKAAKQPNEEGEIERKSPNKGRMIETAAVGAAVGAIAGSVAGGGKGAGIGAGVGAGAGALGGFLTQRNITLNKGTVLEVRLDHPLQVPR
jgi:uncharacterized protein YcfJ